MSTSLRCLLDKAAARRIMKALLKLASAQELTAEEIHALGLYERAGLQGMRLFIVPPTDNVLKRLASFAAYAPLIAFFRSRTETIVPARYFKRWARRLRDHGFTREDAAVLALGTFGTSRDASVLGAHFVATFDQPMINHWRMQQAPIQKRLAAMRLHLRPSYRAAALPQVRRPEHIPEESLSGIQRLHEDAASYEA